MSGSYKIKEVAERSGFTAPTLRYYEEIGLLPESRRTAAGYRTYDDHTLERLAFVARAKQLGCTLTEIADLVIAWDGGECGPVQEGLRTLVANKLTDAEQQMTELTTLKAELRRAATMLELHRPDGPCDELCGCITDTADSPDTPATESRQSITLGAKPVESDDVPIACTLAADSVDDRLAEWQAMLTHVVHRESLDDGLRATFGPEVPLNELMRLIAAEQSCCQFFAFAITVDTRGVALEVRSPADGLPVLHALFAER